MRTTAQIDDNQHNLENLKQDYNETELLQKVNKKGDDFDQSVAKDTKKYNNKIKRKRLETLQNCLNYIKEFDNYNMNELEKNFSINRYKSSLQNTEGKNEDKTQIPIYFGSCAQYNQLDRTTCLFYTLDSIHKSKTNQNFGINLNDQLIEQSLINDQKGNDEQDLEEEYSAQNIIKILKNDKLLDIALDETNIVRFLRSFNEITYQQKSENEFTDMIDDEMNVLIASLNEAINNPAMDDSKDNETDISPQTSLDTNQIKTISLNSSIKKVFEEKDFIKFADTEHKADDIATRLNYKLNKFIENSSKNSLKELDEKDIEKFINASFETSVLVTTRKRCKDIAQSKLLENINEFQNQSHLQT